MCGAREPVGEARDEKLHQLIRLLVVLWQIRFCRQ